MLLISHRAGACALLVLALWSATGAAACTFDGKPTVYANGTLAQRNRTLPTTATLATWAEFRVGRVFVVHQPIALREVGSSALAPLIPNQARATWRWIFGDGRSAQGHVVAHRYAHPGHYLVTVLGYAPRDHTWFRVDAVDLTIAAR